MKKLSPRITQATDNSFDLFFKNYPRPMWVYDLKSLSFLDVNDAAIKIYGYSRKKFLAMTLKDIRPKSQAGKLMKNISSKRPALQHSGVWTHKLKNGKEIDVEIISHTIKYQNRKAVLALVKDISKEAELIHQLGEVTAKLKVTLYSIGDGVISVDLKSRVVLMNKTAEKLTGWKESEAKSKKLSAVFKIINEQSRKKVESPIDRVLRDGIVVGLANHTILIRKDGTEIPIADSGAPVKNENGNIIGVVLVFRNQSKERRLLNRISKLNRIYSILSDTNQSIVRVKEQNKLFKEVCKIAVQHGGFLLAWIGMLDDELSKVKVIDSFGKAKGYLKKIRIDLEHKVRGKGPISQAFKTGKHVVCNNILKDLKLLPWHKDAIKYGFNSSAAFPIKVYGKVVGTFNLYSRDKDFFTSEETKLFDELASDISFALEFFKEEEKKKYIELELKLSKAKIEESEKKFNAITNQATEGIALSDLNGSYVFVNPAFCKMTGYTEKELLQLTAFNLIANDQPIVFFNSKIEKEGIPLEIKLRRKDGSEFNTEIIGRMITIDNHQFVLGTVRDTTERKISESVLRASEMKYRELYENLRDAYVHTDMAGHLIEFNIEYTRMLGYEHDEIKSLTYKDLTPGRWHPIEDKIVREQVLVRGYSDVYEKEYIKKDGTIFPVELRTILMRDSNNNPIGMWAIIRDISKRKQNETALKESEHFLKQVQLVAKIGSYVLDVESGIWQSSELLDSILGITKSYPHTIEGWVNLLHPAHKNEMINHFQNEVLLNHKNFDKEYRIVRSTDGTERWVHGLGELEYDNLNKPKKMLGTIQDITNRKLAEEALRQSVQHLRLLIDSLPVVIYESPNDPNIDATWASGNVEALTGYSISEYLAEPDFWHIRLHPDDLTEAIEKYNLARTKGFFEMEYRWLCKDGHYKWFYDKSILVNKPGSSEFIGVIVDISEKKQAEEALRNAEARYRKFFEEDLSGDFISTVEGKILACNLAFARIFGYDSVEDIMNVNTASVYKSNSERQNFLNLIREKKYITLYEENLVSRNGSQVTVLENAAGEFDENNELIGIQGYLFDITERKLMEEAVKKQLKFAIAANKISETIITQTDQFDILTRTAEIIGETLSTDRSLIYKVDFEKYEAVGLCEWLNPDQSGITSTKDTYPLSLFIDGANFMSTAKKMLTSHFDDINPNFRKDGSGQILHNQMNIKSLLWYPFAFQKNGYYLITLNQIHSKTIWSDEEIIFLDSVSKQLSIAFKKIELTEEIKLSRAQLKIFSNRLEKSREEERARISREIHDILGQNLTALKIDLVSLMKNLPEKLSQETKVESLIKLIEDSIDTVRKISSDLRPGILDQLGLLDSIEWQLSEFENRTKIKTVYSADDSTINLSKDKTISIFRVFQELLTNIARHAEANKVNVKVFRKDDNIILQVEDNGKGITERAVKSPDSIGLLGMRERISAVGGALELFGQEGAGTKALVIVPIKEE